jgi:hypothetical protein
MIIYSDLSDSQQDAVDDAVELKAGYDSLELEPIDDPREAVEYKNFRRELEGLEVERGEMSEEQLEGYLKAGILRRKEKGPELESIRPLEDGEKNQPEIYVKNSVLDDTEEALEINSVWLPGHIETLEENEMLDLEFDNLYVAKDEERGIEKAVYGDKSEYHSNARHGGVLRFRFEGNVDDEKNVGKNEEKIEEMIGDFVYSIKRSEIEEEKDEYVQNFNIEKFFEEDTIDSKPENTRKPNGGDNLMTEDDYEIPGEYHDLEEVYLGMMNGDIDGEVPQQVLIQSYSEEDPSMAQAFMTTASFMYFGMNMDEAMEATVETYGEEAEAIADAAESAISNLGMTKSNAREQIGEMEEVEEGVRDAYIEDVAAFGQAFREHAMHSRDMKDEVSELNEELRETRSDLEDTSPGFFSSTTHDKIEEELEELERVRESFNGGK